MRVIITGATGLVGSAVVRQCITNPAITSALILTRKPLATDISDNPKITVIIHEDFGSYPAELLAQLSGAEGCIWCVNNNSHLSWNTNRGEQDGRRASFPFPRRRNVPKGARLRTYCCKRLCEYLSPGTEWEEVQVCLL